jgi:NitT/TauT family transport system ATP-binding protein
MYPAQYRQQYGGPMVQAFRDLFRDAYSQNQFSGLTAFWMQTLADVTRTAAVERADEIFRPNLYPDFSVPSVKLDHVSLGFPVQAGTVRPVLCDIDLTVQPGEFVAVVGPTGCGKSTLLGLIAGTQRPNDGAVSVMGRPMQNISRHVGYIFQKDALFPWRTVLGNVMVGPLFRGANPDRAYEEAMRWIKRVGLAGFENYYPNQLSGGMRKRAAIAQSLILRPTVLLMDEPFSDLDAQTRQIMAEDLLELTASTRVSVVFVTHDIGEAISLASRVIVLSAAPARIKNTYTVDIPCPRRLSDVRSHQSFGELYKEIWEDLRIEVLKNYEYVRQISLG